MATNHYFATCPRGLEALLAEDLAAVGGTDVRTVPGGAHFSGDWRACYAANLETRIATRILWRVGHGAYRNEDDIYNLARGLSWQKWFDVGQTMRVYITAIKSPLKSLEFATLRIKDAVCDRFRDETGSRPSIDTARPDVRIHAFLTATDATLYLDTSGDPLYRRGFKRASVEAPLKENLAAGILRLAGWQPGIPLLDPMCGSGTFLLEAAQMALDIAPGLSRGFAFEKLKNYQNGLWHRVKGEADSRRKPVVPLAIYGSDLYGEEVARARQNLAAAGLEVAVTLKQADFLEISPPAEAGIVVANPPYGVRIQSRVGMDQFYPKLGDALKKRFSGWNCHFISADADLPKLIGLKASRRTPLYNGDLECRLYEYRMVSGQNRGAPDASETMVPVRPGG
jgi:putative N6-adenine-specific DNA methylase